MHDQQTETLGFKARIDKDTYEVSEDIISNSI